MSVPDDWPAGAKRFAERAEHAKILAQVLIETGRSLKPQPLEAVGKPFFKTASPFDRLANLNPKREWRDLIVNELVARDGNHCYLCKTDLAGIQHHIDHIIPTSLGGDHTLTNVALACEDCNIRKGAMIVAFKVTSGRPWYALARVESGS